MNYSLYIMLCIHVKIAGACACTLACEFLCGIPPCTPFLVTIKPGYHLVADCSSEIPWVAPVELLQFGPTL